MKTRNVTFPELGLIASTRAMVGAGVGLLLADKFNPEQKRAVGWTLLAVGLISTIPIVAEILHRPQSNGQHTEPGSDSASSHEHELASSGT